MRGTQSYFWGIFLIGIGILMIIKYQFRLNISIPRIIFGVLFLAIGASMLLGGTVGKNHSNIIFSEGNIQVNQPEKEYNTIFGSTVIDLTAISKEDMKEKIEMNTIFGNTLLKIDPEVPTVIKVTSAFASGNTPDGSTIVFGDHTYRSGEGEPVLTIEANVVFGKLEIVDR
ncbi:MAG: hypothetical protein GX352_05955 [Clostridiales bacterium]|nr:hypothetical protein [Clostridiales bacterium]